MVAALNEFVKKYFENMKKFILSNFVQKFQKWQQKVLPRQKFRFDSKFPKMNFCQKYVLLFWPSKKPRFLLRKRLELKIWFHRTYPQDNREKYQSTYYLSKNIIFVAIRNFCRNIEENVYFQHNTKLRVICTIIKHELIWIY